MRFLILFSMKILIATFYINQFGGIIEYVHSMVQAFKDLGHEVDIVELKSTQITQNQYDKKYKSIISGEHQSKISNYSQSAGYCLDKDSGYCYNNYYGYLLPPSNSVGVYEPDALEHWKKITEGTDIILWNFMPTKNSEWTKKGKFDFWWKFYDLPDSVKQVFLVHDAYFNVRACNVSALKKKILFLGCAHLAGYHCCSEIGIRRNLLLNPRYIPDGTRMPIVMKDKRKTDFFAAHVFKSMKHIEELVAAIPYLNKKNDEGNWLDVSVAGTGIEYYYMTSEEKIKSNYMCTRKRDPDLPEKLDKKISLWNRALQHGMNYRGQLSVEQVFQRLKDTKFAVDPSWSDHYARYCRTHINGFIIEAMMLGAYPVLRDYRGLNEESMSEDLYDPLFENVRAVIIPWDATPKQFASILKDAMNNISPKQFLQDTKHNFDLVLELFNAKKNAEEIIRLCKGGRKLVKQELEKGKDSENVIKITKEIMTDFFGIELPIEWES